MIKRLSAEVREKLRSGVAVCSLQQCVEELLLNSVDAGATCVGVRVDMGAFKIQVVDNGSGMDREGLACVGSRYFTSKCSSLEDLENLRFYGFRGEAVASLVSLASLVEITSRTKSSGRTHVKVFKNGAGMDVFESDTARPAAGTTFILVNLFHNLPVRRMRMDPALEGERVRQRVEAISLMHPSVSFTLKNDCAGTMMVQLSKARDTCHRFTQIHGLARAQNLREISHSQGQFKVNGYIGVEGHYNNSLQFLYINDRLLLKTRVHKLLNFLLRKVSSSVPKKESPDGPSATRSPKYKRGQELHAIYIVNIKCCYSEYDICLEPAKTLIEFKDWDGILYCIEETVKAFLSKENLVAELAHEDLDLASQNFFAISVTEKETKCSDPGTQVTMGQSALELIGRTLASEPAHRKLETCLQSQVESKEDTKESGMEMEKKSERLSQKGIDKRYIPDCHDDGSASLTIGNIPCTVSRPISNEMEENGHEDATTNNTATWTSVTTLHSLTQEDLESKGAQKVLPHQQSTNRDGQTGCRKIGLSDPYIHKILQPQSPTNRPPLCQVASGKECHVTSNPFKIILSSIQTSGHARVDMNVCKEFASAIPLKVPKVTFCQKLYLAKETASLDRFRRIYGKSTEVKSRPSATADANTLCHAEVPQTEDGQRDITESDVMQSIRQSPPMSPLFTKFMPMPDNNRSSAVSLATKLCHLKEQKVEGSQRDKGRPSGVPPSENASLQRADEDIQDPNNNHNTTPCVEAVIPEPVQHRSPNASPAQGEEVTAPGGDWLNHYDDSVGKMVYVNKVTGLSNYSGPAMGETRAPCTSDITCMAVSVVSKTGFEYRCYPFQMDVVLPFLPNTKENRVICSGPGNGGDNAETSNSLSSLYSEWNNPVFVRPPAVAVDISSEQADGLAVKIHNILFPYRFSKAMIHSMKVIHQVDKKFLACLINTSVGGSPKDIETRGNLLVLVDQHAAHERVRLEKLVEDSYEEDPDVPGERRLCSSTILPPLEVSVPEEELRLLRSCQPHLRGLGLQLDFLETGAPRVLVGKVPVCFMEKETNELRRGRPSVITAVVEEYLREQIELFCSTGRLRGTLPLTVLKVLASLACHGAIKFNDSLSRDECCSLVGSLSACRLPFQCAHGRPSIAPLVDILHLDSDQKELPKPNLRRLRLMCKAWELYGK